ncbi:hypothetical protein NERG_01797 [Nematocida ausubeli]|uniref:Uncharacterized protein n=1 Tax=Nematocida ausubeli (strain ATCC PRA-371 / ERTm2) TaxID=1913371 RepID=H8ZDX6_NEMA1|nr:hypothetical protein NERG_01797 [Nematocida ausubeli]
MGNREDESMANASSVMLDSSSKSLVDVSWLSSLHQEPAPWIEPTEPLYLPGWMHLDAAENACDTIKIRMDDVYYEFLASKYPENAAEVEEIEKRIISNRKACAQIAAISKNKTDGEENASVIVDLVSTEDKSDACDAYDSKHIDEREESQILRHSELKEDMVFLWDREAAEKSIAAYNASVIKNAERGKIVGALTRACDISESLTSVSFTHNVSFVHICKETAEAALETLEAALSRDEKGLGPALRLKKTNNPQELLDVVLRSISGIGNEEIRILRKTFASVAEISQIEKIESLSGIKEDTIAKIKTLFK